MQTGFEGVWSSTYGRELVLTQSGNVVTGTYDDENGRVSLEVTGERTLEGFWAEDGSQEEAMWRLANVNAFASEVLSSCT